MTWHVPGWGCARAPLFPSEKKTQNLYGFILTHVYKAVSNTQHTHREANAFTITHTA